MWVWLLWRGIAIIFSDTMGTEACCIASIFESASNMSVAAWRGKCQGENFTGQK